MLKIFTTTRAPVAQGRLTSGASKPAGSGTGLGLSLSYDIVTQGHGGTLMVKGTEGQGATFVVTQGHGGTLTVENREEGEGATFILSLPADA